MTMSVRESAIAEAADPQGLYDDAIVVDGLNMCNWSREIFGQWREGGFTAVSCTCGLWENTADSRENIHRWRRLFEENQDLIFQVFSVADIERAKREGKTGVILSWQNTAGIEDRIDRLSEFEALGVKVMQIAYNTQNYAGCGYVEEHDSGLTGFGREVVDEMARLGIACDLSHVGTRTIADVIARAKMLPCFSHVLPAGMKDLKRNIPDELLRAVGAAGGMIGISDFGPFMRRGNDSTIEDYLEAIGYVIDLAGEDHVGVGSDSTQGHARPGAFLEWCNRDKGCGRLLTTFAEGAATRPLGRLGDRRALGQAMADAGWSTSLMRKILGANWVAYFERVWRRRSPVGGGHTPATTAATALKE